MVRYQCVESEVRSWDFRGGREVEAVAESATAGGRYSDSSVVWTTVETDSGCGMRGRTD